MVFRNFRFQCIVRILLLICLQITFVYLLFQTSLHITTTLVGIIICFQTIDLIRYVEKTNRDIARFFDAIKYEDFSQTFSREERGLSFRQLNEALAEVIGNFRRTRTEKEEHYRYLQTVVQHVGVGLIAFRHDGMVELVNTAAKKLLHVPYLKNIHTLTDLSPALVETLFRLRSGEKALVKVQDNSEILQLAVYAAEFRLREQQYTLVSLQNIQSELEEKEMEAWQNLVRVLTHEIMNSITPIASLAATVNDLLVPKDYGNGTGLIGLESLQDIREGLQTIRKRSHGLLHFVDTYRNLTRIPRPNFSIFPVEELFEQVRHLMQSQIMEHAITFTYSILPQSLELTADPEMVEQVLINLLLNAVYAVKDMPNPTILLRAFLDTRGRVILQVVDNGPGIEEEVREKIFIPFFTTKKGGSGIGLSLSRQIMRLHHGGISVYSHNQETIFTLRF